MKRVKNSFFLPVFFLFTASALSCRNDERVVIEADADVTDRVVNYAETRRQFDSDSSTVAMNANLDSSFAISESLELFNGQDLDGWTDETGSAPKGWTVKNGVLCLTDPQNGGDLLTRDAFDNFVFSFEWRFGLGCNSGVKYKIERPNEKGWLGLEYQIQDDANVEDGKIPKRRIASLFDMFEAETSSKASDYPSPTEKSPSGNFRSGKIVVKGNRVEHWIDGECVLTFEIGSDEWNEAKDNSKFKNQKKFGLVESSPLLLQCHGHPIEFRNLRLLKLEKREN